MALPVHCCLQVVSRGKDKSHQQPSDLQRAVWYLMHTEEPKIWGFVVIYLYPTFEGFSSGHHFFLALGELSQLTFCKQFATFHFPQEMAANQKLLTHRRKISLVLKLPFSFSCTFCPIKLLLPVLITPALLFTSQSCWSPMSWTACMPLESHAAILAWHLPPATVTSLTSTLSWGQPHAHPHRITQS